MASPRYLPAGEAALVVEFGESADPAFHEEVLTLDASLAAAPIEGVRECLPTYRSLMIRFDPRLLTTADLIARLESVAAAQAPRRETRRWRIPACYDTPHCEDLEELAELIGRPPKEVAALHAAADYRVVMYGFAPGFVFLSGLPDALAISRRRTPRAPAPGGALTVANGQALIASIAMPTGWYMLGRTPARTFDLAHDPVFPLGVGDTVAFERIDAAAFDKLEREAGRRQILEPEV